MSQRDDTRGQAAPIGVVLVLALSLIAATGVVVLGSTALTDTQQRSELGQAEHSMTQFDSQISQVALGDSDVQTVRFGQSKGTYSVKPSTGHIRIVHANFNESNDDGDIDPSTGSPNDDAVLYETDLGAVAYENRDRTIVYQGGGVWRKGRGSNATMVSPPEFHYRGSTLTLPIVHVVGTSSAGSGGPRATIRQVSDPISVYPDESRSYPDDDVGKFLNPAENGSVYADIQSEYYRGWASYFRSRTEGNVTVFDNNNTARVELVSTGKTGPFQMPGEGSSIEVRGVEGHSMTDFSIEIVDDQDDNADLSNLQWSMWVEDGDKQFELHLRQENGGNCGDPIQIKTVVYYSPSDGDSDRDDPYHGWKNTNAYQSVCEDVDGDGDDEAVLRADFVDDEDNNNNVTVTSGGSDEEDPTLTYSELSSSDVTKFDSPGDNLLLDSTTSPQATFSGHTSWEPRTYDEGDSEPIDRVINHYFSELGPGFDLTVEDKNSNTVEESLSSGYIDYVGSEKFVTYMHITENQVEVEID